MNKRVLIPLRVHVLNHQHNLARWDKIFPLCRSNFCKVDHDSSQGDFTPNSMAYNAVIMYTTTALV